MKTEEKKVRMKKFLIELRVANNWIEDGFDLSDEKLHELIWNWLPYAYDHEFAVRLIKGGNTK